MKETAYVKCAPQPPRSRKLQPYTVVRALFSAVYSQLGQTWELWPEKRGGGKAEVSGVE